MNVAIPYWQGRISPVFDVATRVLIVEIDQGACLMSHELLLTEEEPRLRAARLVDAAVSVLICGAISRHMEMALQTAGITVIPQRCGDVEQVLAAFSAGRLHQDAFLMPGCCGRHRGRGRHGHGGCWRNGLG